MQSVVFGYIRVRAGTDRREVTRLTELVADFADRSGLTVTEIFIESQTPATSAFAALTEAARRGNADLVIVPELSHFGQIPGVQTAMKGLLERETGAVVVTVTAAPDSQTLRTDHRSDRHMPTVSVELDPDGGSDA